MARQAGRGGVRGGAGADAGRDGRSAGGGAARGHAGGRRLRGPRHRGQGRHDRPGHRRAQPARATDVVALGVPTEREAAQWYFQRYVEQLPAAGEIALFDRCWYNRAGVERVMGFCTEEQAQDFLRAVPDLERMLVERRPDPDQVLARGERRGAGGALPGARRPTRPSAGSSARSTSRPARSYDDYTRRATRCWSAPTPRRRPGTSSTPTTRSAPASTASSTCSTASPSGAAGEGRPARAPEDARAQHRPRGRAHLAMAPQGVWPRGTGALVARSSAPPGLAARDHQAEHQAEEGVHRDLLGEHPPVGEQGPASGPSGGRGGCGPSAPSRARWRGSRPRSRPGRRAARRAPARAKSAPNAAPLATWTAAPATGQRRGETSRPSRRTSV